MRGSILYVSYPLLPVTDESCGGAEQMLALTERCMFGRGWDTCMAASAGSRPAGRLFSTGAPASAADHLDERAREQDNRIFSLLRSPFENFDLLHDKSGSFWKHAAQFDVPVLATLHLPRSFYDAELFEDIAPNVFFNCVSESQAQSFQDLPNWLGVIQNGIEIERFPLTDAKHGFLLCLGRICEEKGTHIALDVAEEAQLPIVIAGQVYPFSYHQKYFEREIKPRILRSRGRARLLDQLTTAQKIYLLRHAWALLLPTSAEETSSLVSMEAMACGTPVVACRRGAVPEVVEHGVTGLLVDEAEEMLEAVKHAADIDPRACRERVERLYTADRMANQYEELYTELLIRSHPVARAA
jgi:glycosyltransferase involved in cell wall biosynthesis